MPDAAITNVDCSLSGPSLEASVRIVGLYLLWTQDSVKKLIGEEIIALADRIKLTDAKTPEEYRDRIEAIETANVNHLENPGSQTVGWGEWL